MMRWLAALSLSAAIIARLSDAAELVLAHFMVQNSYAYDVAQWQADMKLAKDIGIDGFALNWIPPDCQPNLAWSIDRIDDAFTAAAETGFKLVHSFDMSYSECNIYWNQTFMAYILTKHAGSAATYRWNNTILVTTFAGDTVSQYGNDFFQGLKDLMRGSNPISLAPALTGYSDQAQTEPSAAGSSLISQYPSIDGFLNWQAWPLNVHQNVSVTPDRALKSALHRAGRAGPYIMAVSPWQYKDLNDGNPMDSWVAYSDTLLSDRFESITGKDAFKPDIIELISWNDFAESHYIRDLPPENDETATDYVVLGDMGNYVWGHPHGGFRTLARYYLHWFKTGDRAEVDQDQVIYWYRTHPKAASCSGGASTPVRNSAFPADAVFAWALVKESATISMSLGTNQYWNFEARAGVPTIGMVPFPADLGEDGASPEVAIMRQGNLIHWSKGPQPVTSQCTWEDFNPVVGICGP